jgi:hypothetical protein
MLEEFSEHLKDQIAACGLELIDGSEFSLLPQREVTGVIIRPSDDTYRELAYVSHFVGTRNIYRTQSWTLQNRYDVELSQHRIRFSTPRRGLVAHAVSRTHGKTIFRFEPDFETYFCRGYQTDYYEDFYACVQKHYVEPLVTELCRA